MSNDPKVLRILNLEDDPLDTQGADAARRNVNDPLVRDIARATRPIVNTATGKKFMRHVVYLNSGNGWRSVEGGASIP